MQKQNFLTNINIVGVNSNKFFRQGQELNLCQVHSKPIGNFFCKTCLTFKICTTCICRDHHNHQIINSFSKKESIHFAKDCLLQNVEESLERLKSRQNQMKNMVGQIKLINNSFNKIKQDLIISSKNLMSEIKQVIDLIQKGEECKYTNEIECFNRKYQKITQDLRLTLLSIINGNLDIWKFDKSMVIIDPPALPNFQKIKNDLEKQKRSYKDAKKQIQTIQSKISGLFGQKKYQNSSQRYQKFMNLSDNHQEPKQSFLKTLRIIDKQNFSQFINVIRKN